MMANREEKMTPEYKEMAIRLLKRQILAESATAELFGRSLSLGPTWRDRVQQAQFTHEEAEHVEICGEVLEMLGADVDKIIAGRGDAGEFFGIGPEGLKSWVEVVAFNLIGDRAGTAQIRAYNKNSLKPWGDRIGKILRDEARHQGYGAEQSVLMCKDLKTRRKMQETVNRLLPATVKRAFGRLVGEENEYCIKVGLKSMTTDQVQSRYFAGLVPVMAEAGLTFPSFEEQGVALGPKTMMRFGLH